MSLKEYHFVPEDSTSDDENPPYTLEWHNPSSPSSLTKMLLVVLTLSLLVNIFYTIQRTRPPTGDKCSTRTKYAGLERNVPTAWTDDSDFASHNRTVWDNAWQSMDADIGTIAISDDVVAEKELPPSQRWPWDSSKGIYYMQGYHNLHCLKILRTALVEMYDEVPQSLHFSHINHCLDAIREDIVCNADDTPRYTGFTESTSSGLGQFRMCKDWGMLEAWAKQHSACYKTKADTVTAAGISLDSFKYCPDGEKPWEGLGLN